jgi:hypothetical protein
VFRLTEKAAPAQRFLNRSSVRHFTLTGSRTPPALHFMRAQLCPRADATATNGAHDKVSKRPE